MKTTVEQVVESYGIERVGFLTLTFADHVLDAREAQRRFNSLATHILNDRYGARWLRVLERQKSGRVHYHLLVVLPEDIRSGVDFEQFKAGNYKSAGAALRREWAFWRSTAPKYGFGRTEMLPVRSTKEAVADYVGKYIAKHIGQRIKEDKGVRLVSYGKGLRCSTSTRFSWASAGAGNWRRKLCWLANVMGYTPSNFNEKFLEDCGDSWAFHLSRWIMEIRFSSYPSKAEAVADWPDLANDIPDGATHIELPCRQEKCLELQRRAIQAGFDLRAKRKGSRGPCADGATWHDDEHGSREIDAAGEAASSGARCVTPPSISAKGIGVKSSKRNSYPAGSHPEDRLVKVEAAGGGGTTLTNGPEGYNRAASALGGFGSGVRPKGAHVSALKR